MMLWTTWSRLRTQETKKGASIWNFKVISNNLHIQNSSMQTMKPSCQTVIERNKSKRSMTCAENQSHKKWGEAISHPEERWQHSAASWGEWAAWVPEGEGSHWEFSEGRDCCTQYWIKAVRSARSRLPTIVYFKQTFKSFSTSAISKDIGSTLCCVWFHTVISYDRVHEGIFYIFLFSFGRLDVGRFEQRHWQKSPLKHKENKSYLWLCPVLNIFDSCRM